MPANALSRLLAFTERESRSAPPEPASNTFKPLKLSLERLDREWAHRRLRGVRLAVFLLKKDSETLYRQFAADPAAFSKAIPFLRREASQLRKSANLVDKAISRVTAVLERHEREQTAAPSPVIQTSATEVSL